MGNNSLNETIMTEQQAPAIKHGSLGLAIKANDVEDAKAIVKLLEDRREYIKNEQWTELLFKTLDSMVPETAAYLKEKGADITASISVEGDDGRSQVLSLGYAAVVSNNKDLVEWMIKEKWVDEKMVSPSGDTLLVQAVREHAFEVADLLLQGGMSIDYQNLRGVSALHEAASSGDYMAMEWLMERKANPTLETMSKAVACELVPENSEEAGEADQLFEAVDRYMIEYRKTNGNPYVPEFITLKASEIRKSMNIEKPEQQKRVSVRM
jgi:hypothetical protein